MAMPTPFAKKIGSLFPMVFFWVPKSVGFGGTWTSIHFLVQLIWTRLIPRKSMSSNFMSSCNVRKTAESGKILCISKVFGS